MTKSGGQGKQVEPFWLDLDSIKLWGDNPNQGDVGAIHAAIMKFGFNGSLELWDRTAMVGNHRHRALVLIRDGGERFPGGNALRVADDGTWEVLCQSLDYLGNYVTAKAYAIARNRTRDRAATDSEAVVAHLQEIADTDLAMLEATGYDADDLDDLIAMAQAPSLDDLEDEYGAGTDRDFWPVVRVQVAPSTYQRYADLMRALPGEDDAAKFGRMMEAIDPAALAEALPS